MTSLALTLYSSVILISAAQSNPTSYSLEEAVQICAEIEEPQERLSCFESLAKKSSEKSSTSEERVSQSAAGQTPTGLKALQDEAESERQANSPSPQESQPAQDKETRFIIITEEEYEKEIEAIKPAKKRQEYNATVLRSWKYSNGQLFIALTNGEIWTQNDNIRTRIPKDQSQVMISPAAVSGWLMKFPDGRPAMRIKLVQ